MTQETPQRAAVSAGVMLTEMGELIRALRKERGLTLAQLAESTGLSPAIISQLERGLGNPSFVTLAQLAQGLDIPIGRFFVGRDEVNSPVVRRAERRDSRGLTREATGDAVYESLTPSLNGLIEAHWILTPPGHDTSATPFRHGGEEFGVMLSGRKDVYLDGVKYTLEAGDSITYSSQTPHWYMNPYDEECTCIWINTPPTW